MWSGGTVMTSLNICAFAIALVMFHPLHSPAQSVEGKEAQRTLPFSFAPTGGMETWSASKQLPPPLAGYQAVRDSLRAKCAELTLPEDQILPGGHQQSPSSLRKMVIARSPRYLIDTIIVRSAADTTRHLHSFDRAGKRLCHLTQKLKGELWTDESRYVHTYDANGRPLTDAYEEWKRGDWVRFVFEENTYDSSGNRLSWIQLCGEEDRTVYGERHIYRYDAAGNMLSCLLDYFWAGFNDWKPWCRYTYTHDASGNILSMLFEYGWDDKWTNSRRETYTNDDSGHLLTELIEEWSDDQWAKKWHTSYTYDPLGNRRPSMEVGWWLGEAYFRRHTYSYDASGNTLTELVEDSLYGQWKGMYRRTCTYDANGHLLTRFWEDGWSGQWENYNYRTTYTYDANGDELTELWEYWSGEQWGDINHFSFTYDRHRNVTAMVWDQGYGSAGSPSDLPGNGTTIIDGAGNEYGLYSFQSATLSWRLDAVEAVSEGGSMLGEYALLQNYPNPFNPKTEISCQSPVTSHLHLAVYDLLGREVATLMNEVKQPGKYSVEFDGSKLASGVYFYRLQARPSEFVPGRDSGHGVGSYAGTKRLLLLR
jgi:hypothetical protein